MKDAARGNLGGVFLCEGKGYGGSERCVGALRPWRAGELRRRHWLAGKRSMPPDSRSGPLPRAP